MDLIRRKPVSDHPVAYVRLHGLNPDEYDYPAEELNELAENVVNIRGFRVLRPFPFFVLLFLFELFLQLFYPLFEFFYLLFLLFYCFCFDR